MPGMCMKHIFYCCWLARGIVSEVFVWFLQRSFGFVSLLHVRRSSFVVVKVHTVRRPTQVDVLELPTRILQQRHTTQRYLR